jgi:uncharacterized membrane protein
VLLLVAGCVLAAIGILRLARSLEPRQRVVLVAVFVLAVAYLFSKLLQFGLLGHQSAK